MARQRSGGPDHNQAFAVQAIEIEVQIARRHLHRAGRPLHPGWRRRRQQGTRHPDQQRVRWLQGRRGSGGWGQRVRQGRLRRDLLLRPRLRWVQLQDLPRRPGLRRQGRQADRRRARRRRRPTPTRARPMPEKSSTTSPPTVPTTRRVGMIGGSYGGQNQFAIAAQDDRIDAIIPTITWNDLSYSLAPNNTDQAPGTVTYNTPGVAKKEWIDLFFGLGIVSGLQNTTTTADPRPARRLPELPRRGLPRGGPAEHRRLPRPRHPRARPARLGGQLPRRTSRSRHCWCRDRTTPCSTSRRPSPPTAR